MSFFLAQTRADKMACVKKKAKSSVQDTWMVNKGWTAGYFYLITSYILLLFNKLYTNS